MGSSKRKQSLSVAKAIGRSMPMVVKAVPFSVMIYALLGALHGSAWGVVAQVNQRLYDALADLALGDGILREVYIAAVVVTLVMLWQQTMNAVHNYFSNNFLGNKASGRLSRVVHDKMKRMDAQVFEDKDRLDDIEKAGEGKDGAVWLCVTLIDGAFFYTAYYIIMGRFLWGMQPILLLALIFVFVPVALAQIVEAKIHAKLEEESAPIRRQNTHYGDCLVGLGTMKETRLFGAYNFFKKLYMDSLTLLAKKEWDTHKKIALIYLGLNFLKTAGWLGILALLFNALVQRYITVGAFAAVFGSIGMLFGSIEELLARINSNLTNNLGKIHNFLNLLDIPTMKKEDSPPDFAKGILAKNISFAYPKAEKNAVDGVSIEIPHGETLAIVGENGSGKTTLVKLLCGLFKPDSGDIHIGGRNSAQTSDSALFSKTSAVFQNYTAYAYSLEENIRISQPDATHDIIPSLKDADVPYDDEPTFPNGIKTILSREFEGVDLSGGQWQRIATARGLFRTHEFIILDEPTAAIDPLEETRIYKRFAELVKNKTAILITHRLGSARIADRIAVMHEGKIVETGTHDSLIKSNGKYAEMWLAQSEGYSENMQL